MDILDFYRLILRTASMEVEDNGCVSAVLGGQSTPKMIDGKRLVIPTKNQLANPDWNDRIAFHPFSENILRGESPVIETLRKDLNTKVNLTVSALAYELITIAASKAKHAGLSPDQSEFLTRVSEASEKDTDFLKKLFKEMPFGQSAKAPVSLFLKRGGNVGGKRYARVGVVSFPLYNELRNGEPKVWGIKPSSAKVRENALRLFDYIIPKQDEPESYYRGSDSRSAPYFEALMSAFLAVAAPINDIIDLFENQLEDAEGLRLESEWFEAFQDLEQFAHKIPSLKGNQGNTKVDEPVVAATPASTTADVLKGLHVPPVAQAQAQAPAPVGNNWPTVAPVVHQAPVNHGGGISFADLARNNPAIAGHMAQPSYNSATSGYNAMNYGMVPNNMTAPNGVMPGSGTQIGGTNFNGSFGSLFGNGNQPMTGFRV